MCQIFLKSAEPFLPAALPTGLGMIGVVLLVLVLLVLVLLVAHYFQKTPKRGPILTKLSGVHPGAKRKLFCLKSFLI